MTPAGGISADNVPNIVECRLDRRDGVAILLPRQADRRTLYVEPTDHRWL